MVFDRDDTNPVVPAWCSAGTTGLARPGWAEWQEQLCRLLSSDLTCGDVDMPTKRALRHEELAWHSILARALRAGDCASDLLDPERFITVPTHSVRHPLWSHSTSAA